MENSATIDRISDLPDEVLCHILSFLPIKLAFVTSVLSKRWTPLCNLLTALRFNDKSVRDKESFLRFCLLVESLTVSPHVPQPPVKTFHLKCSSGYWYNGSLKINKWVEAAKLRRVEDLNISFMNDQWYWYNRITLDPNTFKCPTLVVLKLSKLRVVGEKKFSAYLPSLKTLYLENVTLQNSEDLKTLLSNCPILEDLHTEMYYLDGGGGRPVGFKTLSKLVRADICLFDVPFRAIYNVEFLRLVKIKETLYDAELNSYYKDLPVFRNLIHLELKFYDFRHGWDDVVGMLQHCPKLQILLIKKVWKHESKSNLYTNWKYPNYVPECVSSHLRSCTITSSCGLEDELRFATYILQNARLLQVMTINSSESLNSMQKHQFLDELSSCPKISPECKVSLTISRYPFF